MVIRAYQPFDAVPLAALFYQTVHTVNPKRLHRKSSWTHGRQKDIDLGAGTGLFRSTTPSWR